MAEIPQFVYFLTTLPQNCTPAKKLMRYENMVFLGGWGFGTEMRAIFLSSGLTQKIIA